MHYQGNALPKRKPRFWCGVIYICIVFLLAWLMEAWGHGEGKCLTDVDGNVPLSNGGWVKIIDHLEGADLDGYVHGHRSQYYDKHGTPTIQSTGFFSIDFDDNDHRFSEFYADCPSASPPPVSRPTSTPRPTTPTPRPTTPRPRTNPTPSASAVIELPDPDEQPAPPDNTSMIDNPVEAVVEAVVETEPVELVYHEWTWRRGYNLVSFPVMREGIETVADLYQEYALFNAPQDIIYVAIDGCWFAYNGQEGQVAGEVRITPYLGVVMVMDWAAILGMHGIEQIGDGELELIPGLNVVGLSELPSLYRIPSDFLRIDGIEAVMVTAWDDEKKMSDFSLIGRAGDPGDNPLFRGQAVVLIVSTELTLDLNGDTPSAPGVHRTLRVSWGAMKAR